MELSIKKLLAVSAFYILLPVYIFLLFWVKPSYSFLFLIPLTIFLVFTLKHYKSKDTIRLSKTNLLFLLLILIFWTVLSGAGHRNYESGDGFKHNAILADLIAYDWPVQYVLQKAQGVVYLCYYIGYYLPSALVGKFVGWHGANLFLFLWTLLGIYLSFFWFIKQFNKKDSVLFILLLFIFFGGLDSIGHLILRHKAVNGTDWEWWARTWQYSGNTTLFFYVPQHALASWISMGILTYAVRVRKVVPFIVLIVCSLLLWSPFVFVGTMPFVIYYGFQNKNKLSKVEFFLSSVLFFLLFSFFISNMAFMDKQANAGGWLWNIEKLFHSFVLIRLLLFYVFEFLLFFVVSWFVYLKNEKRFIILNSFVALVILFIVPWYKIGLLNDFAMRVSIPALWIISLLWIKTTVLKKKVWIQAILIICCMLGAVYQGVLIVSGFRNVASRAISASLTVFEDPLFRKQYLARPDSLFFSTISKTTKLKKVGYMKFK